tara:strand:+ start:2123 stop:2839 length:717 start_codon:yes stop_codon:yes gene_type:complete
MFNIKANNKKLLIVIPVYNEEDVIEKVLYDWINLKLSLEFKILVIDDGSKDSSIKLINKVRKNSDKIIEFNRVNSGHGNTILFGYKYALENNYDLIFQTDSDNQFNPKDLIKLLGLLNSHSELILGERKKRKDVFIRVLLSKIFLRGAVFVLFGKFIKDPNIPYRLITKKFLTKFIKSLKKDSYLAPNILMAIYAKKIDTIEVNHYERKTGNLAWSSIKLFKFCFNLFFEIIIYRFKL